MIQRVPLGCTLLPTIVRCTCGVPLNEGYSRLPRRSSAPFLVAIWTSQSFGPDVAVELAIFCEPIRWMQVLELGGEAIRAVTDSLNFNLEEVIYRLNDMSYHKACGYEVW